MPYRITQCYLPPVRGDIPALCAAYYAGSANNDDDDDNADAGATCVCVYVID